MTDRPLWTVEAMAAAMGAAPAGPLPLSVPGISIDTRTIAPGEAFFAIKGDNRDGHDFVRGGARGRRRPCGRRRRPARPLSRHDAPLLVVPDVLDGLRDLARAARARSQAKIVAVTGSVGKTSTKEALRLALARDGETHASVASYNNHWGVPLSLARCPQTRALRRVRDRHEPRRRDRAARRAWCGRRWRSSPRSSRCISNSSARSRRSPTPRPRSFSGIEPGGAAVINRDNPQFARLERGAQSAGVARIVSLRRARAAPMRG